MRNGRFLIGIIFLVAVFFTFFGCKKRVPAPEGDSEFAAFKFEEGVKVKAGEELIDVEIGHLVPCVVDWNNDGKKDLVVGQFKEGAIRLYLNEGTDAAPVFGEFAKLEAGGKPIKLDAG